MNAPEKIADPRLTDSESLPIVRKDLPGEIVMRLQQDIINGVYKAGDRITEQALAKRFGVSRTPLRVALQVVAAEGLLVLQPNRGAVLPAVTADVVRDGLAVTGALEELAIEAGCKLITDTELEELRRLNEKVLQAYGKSQTARYFELVDSFHYAIIKLSRNPLLIALYDTAHRHVMRARNLGEFRRQLLEPTEAEHAKILAALKQRNKRAARAASARHTRTVIESVGRNMDVEASADDAQPAPRKTRARPAKAA